MATSYLDIYFMNSLIKEDCRLVNNPSNTIYKIYYGYLQYAISYFIHDCYKDLTDRVPFSQQEYTYYANGKDNIFQLTKLPEDGSQFYVGTVSDSGYTKIQNYTYDASSGDITINGDILAANTEVYIASYVIGQFNVDLNDREINILAEGMSLPYIHEMNTKNSLLTQIVYNGSSKIYSQAQHIAAVTNLSEDQYWNRIYRLIADYTYREAPDNLRGLGGNSYEPSC